MAAVDLPTAREHGLKRFFSRLLCVKRTEVEPRGIEQHPSTLEITRGRVEPPSRLFPHSRIIAGARESHKRRPGAACLANAGWSNE